MAAHPNYREIASDLSQRVLEKRRLRGELTTPALDSTNQTLHALPSQIAGREAFIADRDAVIDRDDLTPMWHYRGKRKQG